MTALFGEPTMERVDDTTFRYTAPTRRYRLLLNTGEIVDVLADRDTSIVRELLLKEYPKGTMIAGGVDLGIES